MADDGLNSAERRARAMLHADVHSVAARRRHVARRLSTNQNAPFVVARFLEGEPFLRVSMQARRTRTLRLLFSLKDLSDQVERGTVGQRKACSFLSYAVEGNRIESWGCKCRPKSRVSNPRFQAISVQGFGFIAAMRISNIAIVVST